MSTSTTAAASPASTRVELTRTAGRGYTVIRNIFVQVRAGNKWSGSSLGRLVSARQPRSIKAYLLLLMISSAIAKRPAPLEAGVWARALSASPPTPPLSAPAMSRVWADLEEHGLVEKSRQARLVKVEPKREDGRNKAYTRPRPDEKNSFRERYFIVPDAFWLDGWHEKLTLPGIAVLLILLYDTSARDDARLPFERVQQWYGISPKTLQNGLDDLRAHELLAVRREWVEEPLSAIGRTQHVFYGLNTPFSRSERTALQKRAATETRARAKKAGKRRIRIKSSGGRT
jgi:hypothetical protein